MPLALISGFAALLASAPVVNKNAMFIRVWNLTATSDAH